MNLKQMLQKSNRLSFQMNDPIWCGWTLELQQTSHHHACRIKEIFFYLNIVEKMLDENVLHRLQYVHT